MNPFRFIANELHTLSLNAEHMQALSWLLPIWASEFDDTPVSYLTGWKLIEAKIRGLRDGTMKDRLLVWVHDMGSHRAAAMPAYEVPEE